MNRTTYSFQVYSGTPTYTWVHLIKSEGIMSLFSDEQLTDEAKAKTGYRLIGVTTKLSPQEVEDIERLAKKHGLQRSEFIRQLILDELARESGEPPVSPELIEILGLRLMLTNLLRPVATGQKITPEIFDGMIAEVKKHKRNLAVKTRTDLERT
jgi:Ribbon-helix-helix protein, copG family